jgi:hypothetical protein
VVCLQPLSGVHYLSIIYIFLFRFIVGTYHLVSEPSYPNHHPHKQSYISNMSMWEEIEAVFDKIEKWHREFQLRFSQPFFYSLTKKLPQISRSSRNHCTSRHSPHTTHRRSSKKLPPISRSSRNYCTCRQSATHRHSTHSDAPMDFAPQHNHLLIQVPHLPLWLSNCKKKRMCFLHLSRNQKKKKKRRSRMRLSP